jgi:oxalate decarboxylase/phosphoglucose isomerase-like protein (cupin superfamily)
VDVGEEVYVENSEVATSLATGHVAKEGNAIAFWKLGKGRMLVFRPEGQSRTLKHH